MRGGWFCFGYLTWKVDPERVPKLDARPKRVKCRVHGVPDESPTKMRRCMPVLRKRLLSLHHFPHFRSNWRTQFRCRKADADEGLHWGRERPDGQLGIRLTVLPLSETRVYCREIKIMAFI